MRNYVGSRFTLREFVNNDTNYLTDFNTGTIEALANMSFVNAPINGATEILANSITGSQIADASIPVSKLIGTIGSQLANNVYLLGTKFGGTPANMIKVNTSDNLQAGLSWQGLTLARSTTLSGTLSGGTTATMLQINGSDLLSSSVNWAGINIANNNILAGTLSGGSAQNWMKTTSSNLWTFLSDAYSQNLYPSTTATYQIGSTSSQYSLGSFGALQVGSSGNSLTSYTYAKDISFTIQGGTSAGTGTYVVQSGDYIKFGNWVYIWGRVQWSAHTGTGVIQLVLPFNTDAFTGHNRSIYACYYFGGGASGQLQYYFETPPSVNYAALNYTTTGGGTSTAALTGTGEVSFSGFYRCSTP